MGGLPAPGEYFGHYLVEGTLGRGGMGVVLLARQPGLDRTVALKLLSPDLATDEEFVGRFRREAAALGRLDSAHVVRAYDAGEHDGWLYIATQHVPDGDLGRSLDREGPFAPGDALALLDQVLLGLHDAHTAGLLHRDIKPNNVLLRGRRPRPHAYLCDLGISQLTGEDQSLTVSTIGTPAFMAPERFAGRPASVASDLYSVGCLLWCLVSGAAPYAGTHLTVIRAHEQAPIPQLVATTTEEERVNLLLRVAMAKVPEQRFTSAGHMRAVLHGAPAPETVPSPVPASQYTTMPGMPAGPLGPRPVGPPVHAAPTALPAPPPPPPPAPVPARGRRGAVLVAAAVAALAASLAGGYAVAEGGRDDGGDRAETTAASSSPDDHDSAESVAPAPRATDPATRTDESEPSAPAPAEPIDEPSDPAAGGTEADDAAVACWDGSGASSLATCPALHGVDAMAWVFPSFDPDDPACFEQLTGLPAQAVLEFRCEVLTPSGLPGTLYYREWTDVDAGVAFYEDKYGVAGRGITNNTGDVVFAGWERVAPDQQAARIFSDAPFAVSLDAPGSLDPRNDLKDSVRFQPSRNFPG